MLAKALDGLISQVSYSAFTYEVVVVDNDLRRSAEDTVRHFQATNKLKIIYDCEPEQNIALARNRAIQNATGNLIAFMDDDEFPKNYWLLKLHKTYTHYGVDGVLGPVLPHFNGNPPDWLTQGKFCERKSHDTGTVLHWDDTRTGNVLLSKLIFNYADCGFDARFGRSGGEDVDFFKKSIKCGRTFIWCNEAPVYETVTQERWKKSFYLRTNLRIGGLNGERKRGECGRLMLFFKYIVTTMLYLLLLPITIFMGRHNFYKFVFKLTYNFGWFVGFFRNPIIRNRTD